MAAFGKDFTLVLRASQPSMENLQTALSSARTQLRDLQQTVYELQDALNEVNFVIDATSGDEATTEPTEED